ncbi:ABC transporter transmembrane domain-containing protein [Cladophialophora immunda]|nr:ABC transporter transmembrane domain-containing protein [Cladophialophora immunda]
MTAYHTSASVAISIASLAIVCALSAPALRQVLIRIRAKKDQYQELSRRYEDKDGKATEESQQAYSDFVVRLILIIISAIAFLDALATAVLTTTRPHLSLTLEQWLQFATWLLVLFQAITIYITPSSKQRYRLGIFTAFSSLLTAIAVAVENVSLWQSKVTPLPRNAHLTLSLVQFICGIILSFAALSIPRRPDVYWNDKPVDRQNTVSALSKLTFSWASAILSFAAKNKGLDYDDLYEIDHDTRSRELRAKFEAVGRKDKLWKTLFWSHKWAFIQQWVMQATCSITDFLPQVALYFILKALEARDEGENVALTSWLLAIGLGLSITFSSWLEAWMFFVTFMRIGVPIYEQLSAVVFGKAIRRKDVKGTGKKQEEEEEEANGNLNGEVVVNIDAGHKGEDRTPEEDEDGDFQKSKQSTINLVGVDSKRISDFATFNYIFLGSAIKLIFAIGFLSRLIGPIPLLAGLAAPALITPINIIAAKRYATAQDDLMKYRDQKMAVVTEALQGIRQIKFSALERDWYEKILETRRRELKTQWQVFVYDTTLISIWIFGPVMLAAVSLTTYVLIYKQLTASVAFTTISVFEAIEMTLAVIPEMITDLLDAIVSANRVQEYLDAPERIDSTKSGDTVVFKDATVSWPSDNPENEENQFSLRNLNLAFPKNELSVISGRTGSGKSLLLASIIGEAEVLGGEVFVPRAPPAAQRYDSRANRSNWVVESSIAFVAQIPWIENATIRDNILFGLPLDNDRYQKVLHACALTKDLEMLPDGELTDIGANGINLSGGQKWRVSFARALYSRAGILVLDDIFSAVDAHVGRHLFEQALAGELGQDRTRILVTHHVALCLPKTNYSVLLSNGTIEQAGKTEELRRSGKLKSILAEEDEEEQKRDEEEEAVENLTVDDGGGLQKLLTNQSRRSRRKSALSDVGDNLMRRPSRASLNDAKQSRNQPKKFTEEEKRETGAVKYKIYTAYFRASGGFGYWFFILAVFGVWVAVYLGRSYWISVWTRSYRTETEHILPQRLISQSLTSVYHDLHSRYSAATIDPNLRYYLGVYLGISLVAWLIGTVRYLLVFIASIRASKVLFEGLAFAVLRAPLRWLDTVPVGRILNRFTSDFNMLDSRIAMDLAFMLHNMMHVLSVVIAGLFVSPFMIVFAVGLLSISMYYALRYLAGAREVKRLESNAKSPVFEQFGSVLMGIGTIRAFDKSDAYLDKMYAKIDRHCRAYWHLWLFNRWMGLRLNMVGAVFAAITAALIVSITSIDSSLAGFALSFALGMSEGVIWFLRQYSNVELDMNATERIVEYSNITTENQGGVDAPAAWPTEGNLEVNDLVVGYAPDLPPVLKGLTFSVTKNQRIGVVGRTGAGKSSLTLALFRFLEARSGTIYIDGVDISKIKLYDLRSRLAIIPQDPVLFSGTVRSNLDPFEQQTDKELKEALARVHLIPSTTASSSAMASGSATPIPNQHDASVAAANINIFRSLSSKISEGGLNLSQGQRQLLCLARAIRSIREEFTDSTLIVIAHRLSTIADFDKILVMGEGKVLEFDGPRELMGKKGGVFRGMVEMSGERAELERIMGISVGVGVGMEAQEQQHEQQQAHEEDREATAGGSAPANATATDGTDATASASSGRNEDDDSEAGWGI